jgi:hypothetical protein
MTTTPHDGGATKVPNPVDKLARLKTIVEHLGNQWTAVIYRQTYFHTMTRSSELGSALNSTYAAHVHNAIVDTFVIDLIREIGALVLDNDSRSASVSAAMQILRDSLVLDELRKDYRVVLPSRWLRQDVPADVRHAIDEELKAKQVLENLSVFEAHLAELPEIQRSVIESDVGSALRVARNKSVAHYDVVREGEDWKLWRVEGTGLTYGKLDEYVDACTLAVDRLMRLVKREAPDFESTRNVARDYADDYIEALVIGLGRKKEILQARLAKLRSGA